MRIVYVTDLHGAFDRLELLLELTSADLYVISGDLLYNPFYTLREMEAFTEAQLQVRRWYPADDPVALPLRLKAALPRLDPGRRQVAETYLRLERRAYRSMRRKYRALERLRHLKPRTPVRFLPGNYDLDLAETALAPYDLHKRLVEWNGVRIAGYGGAPVFTPGVPQHLAVRFHEEPLGPGARSELLDTFRYYRPYVAVTHTPPLGILDGGSSRRYGSWGLREAIEELEELVLVLCGHVHERWGVRYVDGTWVVNAGNFGAVVTAQGYRRGGYFAEVFLDVERRQVQTVILKRLERAKIWHLSEYRLEGSRLRERILDVERVHARTHVPIVAHRREADDAADLDVHVAELEMYNQIKLFMRRFETAASEERIEDLREIVARARSRGTEIAFDVLGSLNVGQSTPTSDVDAVLYIGDDPAGNQYDPRFIPDLVAEVVGDRYAFDISDLIFLEEVEAAILRRDAEDDTLRRFVIYRAIGRPVNVRLLRRYDAMLLAAGDLRARIQRELRDDLRILAGTYRHAQSFRKYLERLRDAEVRIPPNIQRRIHRYLHTVLGESEPG